MKSIISKILFCAAFVIVLIACGICVYSATRGSVYIRTSGIPSDNIKNLLDSVVAGDGEACTLHTDSYKKIDLDTSGKTGTDSLICSSLRQSYAYDQIPYDPDGDHYLESEISVKFHYLDLNMLADHIASDYDDYVYDTVMEYDANVTGEDGKYITEIYEKAYYKAVTDALKKPEAYYNSEELQIRSSYDTSAGSWCTEIDKQFAKALQGGITDGIMSDTLSIPNAVSRFVDDSIDVLKGEPVKNKHKYTLPYSSAVGPKPDAEKYVRYSTDQADQVLNIIAYARSCGLLGDQDVIFDPEAAFYPDNIICYCDETILVICWKEYIRGCVCNCMEIKIADGSQIKRKLTGDTYNSGILDYMSNMSAATNAVAAMNADYYAYRGFGTTVFQGQLHRFDSLCELLMIDDKGKFIFYYPEQGKSFDQLQEFINQNNVQFGLAFGPVLIEEYEPRYYKSGYAWGLGQMEDRFTRAAFGEFDELHYLFMTSGYAVNAVPPENLDAFIEILRTKNLRNVYNLDGGQTAEIVIQNQVYNQIDYRAERLMSDMIFFATAIPEGEDE